MRASLKTQKDVGAVEEGVRIVDVCGAYGELSPIDRVANDYLLWCLETHHPRGLVRVLERDVFAVECLDAEVLEAADKLAHHIGAGDPCGEGEAISILQLHGGLHVDQGVEGFEVQAPRDGLIFHGASWVQRGTRRIIKAR